MTITIVAILILSGLLLLMVEVWLIPGSTVVGMLGLGLMSVGVYYTYAELGTLAGHYTLTGTIFLTLALLIWGFKSRSWEAFSLRDKLEGRTVHEYKTPLKTGDRGEALTDLHPGGKALFGRQKVDVSSQGPYLEKGSPIEVVQIVGNNIIVKPIKQ